MKHLRSHVSVSVAKVREKLHSLVALMRLKWFSFLRSLVMEKVFPSILKERSYSMVEKSVTSREKRG